MPISSEFVTADNIINFQAALACPFINHGDTCRSFHIIPAPVTRLAEKVVNILPPLSVHAACFSFLKL